MHLEIDATPLLLRSAGVKSYIYHWLRQLRATRGPNKVTAFPFLGEFGELDHENSVRGALATWPRLALLLASNAPRNPMINWIAGRADIFHATNQVRQPVKGALLTATLHDMTCWLMPELHTAANVKADQSFGRNILKRAAGMIAVSENTRQDAIRLLNLDPDRVTTIHSGVASQYFNVTDAEAHDAAVRYKLTKPYVLYIGTVEPRKNLDRLLDAWKQLPRSIRDEYTLALIGPMGWASNQTSARLRAGDDSVQYLGYVPERDMPALTRSATVFAYPSLYEGFGFPVAQAMACGVPVITSNTSCLPEISGKAALHVDPLSVFEISAALERLLVTPELRAKLGAAGRTIADERYRWERCAALSWQFFERVMGRH